MSTVQVQRLGHVNTFAADHEAVADYHARVLGAQTFMDWEEPAFGGRNALWRIAGTVVEVFSPTRPDGAIGKWVERNGSGWHSLEWTVPSLDAAIETMRERGIRITDHVEGRYAFTHPKDGHGISFELTEAHFPGDQRDEPGWTPPKVGDENPLGIVGPVAISVASHDPDAAARWLADLTGAKAVRAEERRHMNTRSAAVSFPDHVVEFLTPLVTPAVDHHLTDFLRDKGERIFSVGFPVADVYGARAWLASVGARFEQFGRTCLVLPSDETGGARIELRSAV
jgi:catechol 2,3-dioxygenase-like lactoylglutathione lyase family enzyme